jgi:H+/Cl- antiporter ClcA
VLLTYPLAAFGMAAFLAGSIQAPMTAFVIIFEMTGHHQMLLPTMLASLIAVLTARLLGAKHLYQTLAASYGDVLGYNVHPHRSAQA